MKSFRSIIIIIMALPLAFLTGCGGGSTAMDSAASGSIVRHATNLQIRDTNGASIVTLRNPWDTTKILARYLLIHRDSVIPHGIDPTGLTVIRVPLRNSVVYSNIHISLIRELGAVNSIKGVCDAGYVTDTLVRALIADKTVTDCGISTSPTIETIMSLRPDAVLLSPMGNNLGHGRLDALSIPLVETADYLEKTPLGRAEWMKFYGRLYGKGERADSLFNAVEHQYDNLRKLARRSGTRPSVLFDGVYGQTWNVPTSGSAMGSFISDAGGNNPFAAYNDAGSAQLSPEEVLFKGAHADIWFVRYFSEKDYSLEEWGALNKNYGRIKAYRSGNVFGSNTSHSGVFDDGAFHPHWILADLISVLHPEIKVPGHDHVYYTRLRK